jgi:hypothetical protein
VALFYVLTRPGSPAAQCPAWTPSIIPFDSREKAVAWAEEQCKKTGERCSVVRDVAEVMLDEDCPGAIRFINY